MAKVGFLDGSAAIPPFTWLNSYQPKPEGKRATKPPSIRQLLRRYWMITITIIVHALTSFHTLQWFGNELSSARHAGKKKTSW